MQRNGSPFFQFHALTLYHGLHKRYTLHAPALVLNPPVPGL